MDFEDVNVLKVLFVLVGTRFILFGLVRNLRGWRGWIVPFWFTATYIYYSAQGVY